MAAGGDPLRKVLPPSGHMSEETRMARVMALAQKRYAPARMRMMWRTDESRESDGTAKPHRCKQNRVDERSGRYPGKALR